MLLMKILISCQFKYYFNSLIYICIKTSSTQTQTIFVTSRKWSNRSKSKAVYNQDSYLFIEEQLFSLLHPEHPEQQLLPFFFCILITFITAATIAAIIKRITVSANFILTSYQASDLINKGSCYICGYCLV